METATCGSFESLLVLPRASRSYYEIIFPKLMGLKLCTEMSSSPCILLTPRRLTDPVHMTTSAQPASRVAHTNRAAPTPTNGTDLASVNVLLAYMSQGNRYHFNDHPAPRRGVWMHRIVRGSGSGPFLELGWADVPRFPARVRTRAPVACLHGGLILVNLSFSML